MNRERRKATRVPLPEAVRATVDGVPVRVLDLSTVNARVEHEQRFPLQSPRLRLEWNRSEVHLPFRVMRSQIVARTESGLVYQSGIELVALDPLAQGLVASILQWAEQSASRPARTSAPSEPMEDTWTRQVQFLRVDLGDDLSYVQFRLGERGWLKEYVATPAQPDDGFTIPRTRDDFQELQRTFECADAETRRMMRIALESELSRQS